MKEEPLAPAVGFGLILQKTAIMSRYTLNLQTHNIDSSGNTANLQAHNIDSSGNTANLQTHNIDSSGNTANLQTPQ
jgi:hypothetical protein